MRTTRTRLVVATLSLALFGGCQAIRPGSPEAASSPWGAHSKTKQKRNSLLGSWLSAEEPAPPRTMKEWMKLEPVRL